MLVIRAEQIYKFEDAAMRAFEDEMTLHAARFSPALYSVIGEAQLRVAVIQVLRKASVHGFTLKGPMRLFVELMLMCGSSFDCDPQYEAITEALKGRGMEMSRAENMRIAHHEYLVEVAGTNNTNINNALFRLAEFAGNFEENDDKGFEDRLLYELKAGFPERARYCGEQALRDMIRKGRSDAVSFGLPSMRSQALLVILNSAFGHGCASDPLYPWISQTLTDKRIADPKARADRLERKAMTWLHHVLERMSQGAAI